MRTFITTSLAAAAIGAALSLAPASVSITTPAVAYDRTQGGVIPGSRDDKRFVYGRGWVPNQRPHRGRIGNSYQRPMAGQHRGHNMRPMKRSRGRVLTGRSFTNIKVTKRSFVVPTGRIMVYRGTCFQNRRTGELRC